MEGTVDVVEPTGADVFALIDINGVFVRGRFMNNGVKPGRHMRFSVDAGDLHLFDAATGKRL
jgi:ABC-type sugar transport system ATPase subunit